MIGIQSHAPAALGHAVATVRVTLGLAGGTQVHGRLALRGARSALEALNNWHEPVLLMEGTAPSQAQGQGRAALSVFRERLVWACALDVEPGSSSALMERRQQPPDTGHCQHDVVVHAGPFEIHGVITTFRDVNWSDYVLGRTGPPASFFAVLDARITGPGTNLQVPAVAVSAGQVTALLSVH